MTFVLFLIIGSAKAQQNLIPNPSFEDYINWRSHVFSNPDVIDTQREFICFDSSAVPGWFATHWGYNVSYMNTDLNYPLPKKTKASHGMQEPSDGKGYVVIMAYAPFNKFKGLATKRNYIACKLNETLEKDVKYTISFDVSLADASRRYADHLYFAFTELPPIRPSFRGYSDILTTMLKPNAFFSPYDQLKDTADWQTISATYTANGKEKYLVVGHMEFRNIRKNIHRTKFRRRPLNQFIRSPYYYIDNGRLSKKPI